MRNVKTIKVYNLVDSKGNRLALELGVITEGLRDELPNIHSDHGYRWRFIGRNIPMPVRSMYWFNGFPEDIMLDWLKGNGWYPKTRVNMCDGYAHVYELPKGDEEDIRILPERHEHEECVFCDVIRDLVSKGKVMRATALYRYANGGEIRDAHKAVMEICGEA